MIRSRRWRTPFHMLGRDRSPDYQNLHPPTNRKANPRRVIFYLVFGSRPEQTIEYFPVGCFAAKLSHCFILAVELCQHDNPIHPSRTSNATVKFIITLQADEFDVVCLSEKEGDERMTGLVMRGLPVACAVIFFPIDLFLMPVSPQALLGCTGFIAGTLLTMLREFSASVALAWTAIDNKPLMGGQIDKPTLAATGDFQRKLFSPGLAHAFCSAAAEAR